jgi:hypothetical protein
MRCTVVAQSRLAAHLLTVNGIGTVLPTPLHALGISSRMASAGLSKHSTIGQNVQQYDTLKTLFERSRYRVAPYLAKAVDNGHERVVE